MSRQETECYVSNVNTLKKKKNKEAMHEIFTKSNELNLCLAEKSYQQEIIVAFAFKSEWESNAGVFIYKWERLQHGQ